MILVCQTDVYLCLTDHKILKVNKEIRGETRSRAWYETTYNLTMRLTQYIGRHIKDRISLPPKRYLNVSISVGFGKVQR